MQTFTVTTDNDSETSRLTGAAALELAGINDSLWLSEERFRASFDGAPVGIADVSPEGRWLRVNRTLLEMLGFERQELMGRLLEEVVHPEDREADSDLRHAVLKGALDRYTSQKRFVRKDGASCPLRFHVALLRDGEGEPKYFVIVLAPIAPLGPESPAGGAEVSRELEHEKARRRALEQELREKDERWRVLLESTSVIPWEADPRTNRYTYVAPQAVQLLGYPLEEWYREGFWSSHIYALDAERIARESTSPLRQRDFEFEYRMIAADGRLVWVRDIVSAVPGEAPTLRGFLMDVSARKQAEIALRRSEQLFADFFENAPCGVKCLDREGKILRANRAELELVGLPAGEYLGRSVGEFLADAEAAGEMMHRLSRCEPIEGFDARVRRKDGSVRWVEITAAPLFDHKKFIHTRCFTRDITDYRRLELQLLEISDREQLRIGQDLHDGLCQQLVGVALVAELMNSALQKRGDPEAAHAAEVVKHVREAIWQARSLARGLSPVSLEAKGLVAALEEMAERTRNLFNLDCQFSCAESFEGLRADTAHHLYRIAQEAISNAVRHGRAVRITISLGAEGARGRLAITDDGCGIPEPDQRGEGMGLTTMQCRARAIGGSVHISRADGGGTSVRVTFQKNL